MRSRLYGLSASGFSTLLEVQGGVCAICGVELKVNGAGSQHAACVDHDHSTGRVRGLLCRKCNVALGMLDEDIEKMKNMIDYVTKHKR